MKDGIKRGIYLAIALLVMAVLGLSVFAVFTPISEKTEESYSGNVGRLVLPGLYESKDNENKAEVIIHSCKNIDENFNCEKAETFKRGDVINFLIDIKNLKVNDLYYEIMMNEEVRNIANNVLVRQHREMIMNEVDPSEVVNVQVVRKIESVDSISGDYEYSIRIDDRATEESNSGKIIYKIE